jgi:hypothetical protein
MLGGLLLLLTAACDGAISSPTPGSGGPLATATAGSGAMLPPGATPGPAAGSGGPAIAQAGGTATPPVRSGAPLLPSRIRRLSNAEFDASVKALLNIDSKFGASFTPDSRQGGFTRNDAQRVDPVFSTQLNDAAQKLAAMAKTNASQLGPCGDASGSASCARDFVSAFAKRAYRRPPTPREIDALMLVYAAGSDGASHADGLEAVINAALQSPGFLYLTELGAQPPTSDSALNDYEIASSLSYLLRGAPPDDQLLTAAAAGELNKPDKRRSEAQRLLMNDAASPQVVRMVEEWLGIDRITETSKDSNVYPSFAGLRDAMKHEADAFVAEVMWKRGSSVTELLAADWTPAEDNLARMYLGTPGDQPIQRQDGRVSLGSVKRRGILNQGAFLSVYAHATETAPVLRGVALLRRVACVDIPSPTTLNLNVVPPVPDPSKTTRERFSIHSQDAACAGCHKSIDPLGFTFEGLDGMGAARTMENGHPVDSKTTLAAGYSFDGSYADSAELALALSTSADVQRCFARQLFRYAAARSDMAAQPAELAFADSLATLPADAQGKFSDLLLAWIASDAFIQRGANP